MKWQTVQDNVKQIDCGISCVERWCSAIGELVSQQFVRSVNQPTSSGPTISSFVQLCIQPVTDYLNLPTLNIYFSKCSLQFCVSHFQLLGTPIIYSHPPLIDVNLFHELSSISDFSVNKPNLNICFDFHCRAHNFTNIIQKVAKCDEKQLALIRLHYHTMADVSELVNIANGRAMAIVD
jgi:hypothetical protein